MQDIWLTGLSTTALGMTVTFIGLGLLWMTITIIGRLIRNTNKKRS